jgi:CHAT domain-containing protein
MHAGAPRILVSLWDVDDAATAFFMREFYGRWRPGGVGAAEALRLAQMAVRDHQERSAAPGQEAHRPWADPEYWAAWVLWGLPN